MFSDKGDVFVWGSNADGQLGLGKDIKQVTTPVRLELEETIAKVACGYYHTVFLTGNFSGLKLLALLADGDIIAR